MAKTVDPEHAEIFELQTRLLESLQGCIRSGSYMIAVYHLNGTDMVLERITNCFPVEDFQQAVTDFLLVVAVHDMNT